MINWPDLTFGPINLWSLPPANWFYRGQQERDPTSHNNCVSKEGRARDYQSRYERVVIGMAQLRLSQSGQDRYTRDCEWLRSAHTQSEHLWLTIKAHR